MRAALPLLIVGLLVIGLSVRTAGAQTLVPGDSALLAALRRSNPQLAAERSAIVAAEARLRATGFAGPAFLSAEAEEVPRGLDLSSATLRIGLEREFLSGGRREAARALAAAEVRARTVAAEAVELRLLAEADRAVLRIVAGRRIARRLAAEDSLLRGAEEALRARFAVGEARYVDVLRLRTERLRIQSDQAAVLTEAQAGLSTLTALIGLAPDQGREAEDLSQRLEAAVIEPLARDTLPAPPDPDSLLARSPALRLAEVAVEQARAGQMAVAAGFRPRLAASAGVQRFEGDGGFRVGPTLGFSLSLPGTARQARRSALAASDVQLAAAEAQRAATQAVVRGALRTARGRYEAARSRLALFDAALLRGARQEREAALAAYGAGDLSLIELIDFERALSRAEIERTRARVDAADALVQLLSAAAGTGGETLTLPGTASDDER